MRALSRMPLHALPLLVLLCAAAPVAPARAADPASPEGAAPVDQGRYVISVGDRNIGTEDFAMRVLGDSLCLSTDARVVRGSGAGADTMKKQAFMSVDAGNYALRVYQSNLRQNGKDLVRGIVIGDTLFTLYREIDGNGTGDRMVLPPGRMYVIDPMLYSLMNFMVYSLREQSFASRPVNLLTLGARDSMVEATLEKVGTETVAYQQRSVQVRHWRLGQGGVVFDLYVDSRGRLLRILNQPTGLRVERQAQKVKPRPAGQPKP